MTNISRKNLLIIFVLMCINLSTQAISTLNKDEHAINIDIDNKHENAISEIVRRSKRGMTDWLIAPNTRWCGKGNTAVEYNNLGGASAADKCCRQHDHCKYYIPAMGTQYEFFNYRPYTLSHCQCDRRFRTCLKMSNDADADAIGQLFFNIAQMRCFVLRSEKICRVRNSEDGSCQKEDTKLKAHVKEIERY